MNGFDYGQRMQEIMDARGMKPSDFYVDGNYKTNDSELFTKTRFHMVLKGKTKEPNAEFIPKFCKIAGVSIAEFYGQSNLPDELTCSLDDEEKQIIITIRKLRQESGDERIYKLVNAYLKGLAEQKN